MVHHARVRPAHRENRLHRLIPTRERGAPGHLIRYDLSDEA